MSYFASFVRKMAQSGGEDASDWAALFGPRGGKTVNRTGHFSPSNESIGHDGVAARPMQRCRIATARRR